MADKQDKLIPKLRFPEFKNDGEWEFRRLGDIADSFSGGTPTASKADYYGGDIPFIRSGEVNSSKTSLFITQSGLENSSAKMVEKGTILYALYGATSGEVGLAGVKGAINQAILAIVPKPEVDKLFLYQYLKYAKGIIVNHFIQGGQGNLSASIISNLIIPLPSLSEQKRIAAFLTSLDELLSKTKAKLEQLKAHKKGLMQKLFPAPGKSFQGSRFPSIPLTYKWDYSLLGDIIHIVTPPRKLQSFDYHKSGNYPIIDQSQALSCGYSDDAEALVNSEAQGMIVFGDHTCVLKYVDYPFVQGADGIKVFHSKDISRVDTRYLYYFLQSVPLVSDEYKRHFSDLKEKTVLFPTIIEQKRITSLLFSIDEMINGHSFQVETLEKYKKGLMQQIFPASL